MNHDNHLRRIKCELIMRHIVRNRVDFSFENVIKQLQN